MQFSQNETVQALCRTLVHSLWQGLLLAVIAGLVVIFTKKMRAAVRYNILSALLAIFVAGVVFTAYYQISTTGGKTPLATVTQQGFASPNVVYVNTGAPIPAPGVSTRSAIINWFNANAGMIVLAWLLIIAFRCMQMLMGLRGVYILRHKGITQPGEEWARKLTQLAKSINVTIPVTMMQSAIAKVPMVIGHLKPIILIPAGVLTSLPQDEIEAILLHELAHIRRKDYLVNMLQNICEIIFFFNPAVLWISSLIKDERENCCDDIAIDAVKNKKQFIHALISFQEYNMAASNYAIGFPGKRNHLLNRVKRIVTNNNKSLNNMEKSLLATGIVLISFVLVAFSQIKKPPSVNNNKAQTAEQATEPQDSGYTKEELPPAEDTTKPLAGIDATGDDAYADTTKKKNVDSNGIIIHDKGDYDFTNFESNTNNNVSNIKTEYKGKQYTMTLKDGEVTELYVDGEKIPAEKYSGYQDFIDTIKTMLEQQQQMRQEQQHMRELQEQMRHQQEDFRQQQEKMREQQEEFRQQQRAMLDRQDSSRHNQQQQWQEQFREQQEKFREQQDEFRKQQDDMRKQQEDLRRQQDEMRREQLRTWNDSTRHRYSYYDGPPPTAPAAPRAPMAPGTPVQPRIPSVSTIPSAPAAPIAPVAPIAPPPPPNAYLDSYHAEFSKNKSQQIGDELVRENLVNDASHFTYSISNSELSIDGVKQPEETHRRIVDEFFKPGDNFNINYNFKDPGSKSTPKSESDIFQLNNGQSESAQRDLLLQQINKNNSDALALVNQNNSNALSLVNKINLEASNANNPGAKINNSIIADLKQNSVISDDRSLSFTLNDKELIVNGVLQPSSLLDALKAKYLKGPKGYIKFDKTYGHTTSDIHLW